jgi:hypothetical protein
MAIQLPQNMNQQATAQALQASGQSIDPNTKAMLEVNNNLNIMQPFIEAKNTIYDALYTQTKPDQERLSKLDLINPNLKNAVINMDRSFLQSNLSQLENTIQGNANMFNNAIGIITQGVDRMEAQKEREFSKAKSIVEQQVSLLGSKAFEGMPPEQIAMIEKRMGISTGAMSQTLAGKEEEVRKEKEYQKQLAEKEMKMKEDQFAYEQRLNDQKLALQRQESERSYALEKQKLALQQSSVRSSSSSSGSSSGGTTSSSSTKKWGNIKSVDTSKVYNLMFKGPGGGDTDMAYSFTDPNGSKVSMYTWVANNYGENNAPKQMVDLLVRSSNPMEVKIGKELNDVFGYVSRTGDTKPLDIFEKQYIQYFK